MHPRFAFAISLFALASVLAACSAVILLAQDSSSGERWVGLMGFSSSEEEGTAVEESVEEEEERVEVDVWLRVRKGL